MNLKLEITEIDLGLIADLKKEMQDHPIVIDRQKKNIDERKQEYTKDHIWNALLVGLFTTQQNSGENSPVNRLLNSNPCPLALRVYEGVEDKIGYAIDCIQQFGGIRRFNKISEHLYANYEKLQSTHWNILDAINEHPHPQSHLEERILANTMAGVFKGIGLKQSRNVLQYMGFSRWEIPLDSRVMKWCNEHDIFPFNLHYKAMQDSNIYEFILDQLRVLCDKADLLPTLFDAMVFAKMEK